MAGYIGSKIAVTQVDGYNRTEADAEFVQVTGDTMTGALIGTDLTLSGGVYLGGTGAANYLDDYDEGTFTPTFESTTTNPSSVVYTQRHGFYVKVGNLVNCQGLLEIDTFTSNGGNMLIGGLPFNAASISANSDWQTGTVGYTTDFALGPSAAMINEGTNQINLWHYSSSDAQSNRSSRVGIGTDITSGAGATVFFSITYRTA